MGALFAVVLLSVLLSEAEPTHGEGVLGEEHARLDTGVVLTFNGDGSIPAADWKLRQLIP